MHFTQDRLETRIHSAINEGWTEGEETFERNSCTPGVVQGPQTIGDQTVLVMLHSTLQGVRVGWRIDRPRNMAGLY